MKQWFSRNIALTLVLVVLVIDGLVWYHNTRELRQNDIWVTHTHQVIAALELTLSLVKDAETGQRGYIITGVESYLEPFATAELRLNNQLDSLATLTADNPVQSNSVALLRLQINRRMQQFEASIAQRREEGFDASREFVLSGEGKEAMDAIRKQAGEMLMREETLLATRRTTASWAYGAAITANILAVLISFGIVAAAWVIVDRELTARRRAESNANDQSERLGTTLRSIGDAVIVTDPQGRVTMMNKVAESLTGWGAEAIGLPLRDVFQIVNESTRKAVESPVEKALREGRVVGLANHTILISKDGQEHPIDDSAAPILDGAGQVHGIVLVFRDISERKLAEREIRERETFFQNLFQLGVVGMSVVDSEGRIIESNNALLVMLGLSPRKTGQSPMLWSEIVADEEQRQLNQMLSVCRTQGFSRPARASLQPHGGVAVPVLIGASLLNESRSLTVIFVVDLSDIERTTASLRASEEQFRVLAKTLPGILYIASANGTMEFLNQRYFDFTGIPSDGSAGLSWLHSVHPDDRPATESETQGMFEQEFPQEIKFRIRGQDGTYRWFLHRRQAIRNDQGEIAKWVGVATDIDNLVRAEEALRDADHRKDQFLATFAHELRNPLAPLSNALQVWPLVDNDRKEMEQLRGIMDRQVQQMSRLIDDLLDVSRITRGKVSLRKQYVDVAEVVNGAIESVRPLLDRCEHQLIVTLPEKPIYVDGDVARLLQVFGNILHNAIKYTDREGTLRVELEREGGMAVLRVSDNGHGIPSEMLTQVFDLFTQVDQTLDRSFGGLGIGLSLVKTLVELHGGSVTAYSAGLGHGAEFTVRLPAAPRDNSADKKGESTNSTDSNEQVRKPAIPKHRILVVDDVQASAKTLALMLQSIGQDVSICFDGPSALAAIEKELPDTVFLDIGMPGMDGYEVARQLRSDPRFQRLTIFALTGYGQEEDRRRSVEAGFNHHLVKPVSLNLLEHLLATVPTSIEA